jgi:hypothetical protein
MVGRLQQVGHRHDSALAGGQAASGGPATLQVQETEYARAPAVPKRRFFDLPFRVRVCPHIRSGMPTYGSYTIVRPIETARGGGDTQPASVADAAAPHGWGLKGGDTHTHTCHARRRAPQVHGNCAIGCQRFNEAAGCARLACGDVRACSRADGHTRMQPIVHRHVCTTPASTRPYYPKWCWSAPWRRGAGAQAAAKEGRECIGTDEK